MSYSFHKFSVFEVDCMILNVFHNTARISGEIGVEEGPGVDLVHDFNTRGWGREICMGFHSRSSSHVALWAEN